MSIFNSIGSASIQGKSDEQQKLLANNFHHFPSGFRPFSSFFLYAKVESYCRLGPAFSVFNCTPALTQFLHLKSFAIIHVIGMITV